MKQLHYKAILSFCLILFCNKALLAQPNWTKKNNAGSTKRNSAVAFSINNKAYIGTGLSSSGGVLADFWEYNSGLDQWSKKASVNGPRYGAVAFTAGNYAYVVTGGGVGFPYTDTWRYDPQNNNWTLMKPFPAEGRVFGIAFFAGGKGYVGLGIAIDGSKSFNDLWEYDPATDNWTKKSDYPGLARFGAVAFALQDKGYVGTGEGASHNQVRDFWQYNPANDTWTKKNNFPGSARSFAVGFTLGNLGYIGTGESGNLLFTDDVFSYNPVQDSWQPVISLPGVARFYALAFSLGNTAYIACGADSAYNMVKAGNDVWAYNTTATALADQKDRPFSARVYPNPAHDYIELFVEAANEEMITLELTNFLGQSLHKEYMHTSSARPLRMSLKDLASGLYLLKLESGSGQLLQKLYIR